MTALRFDRLAIFKRPASTDDMGGADGEWLPICTGYIGLTPTVARVYEDGGASHSEVQYRIVTRVSGISAGMRIYFGARVFEIDGVLNENERGQLYKIIAREVT